MEVLCELKLKLNRAAEAATRYFQKKMTPELAKAMQPVVEKSMKKVFGAR